MLTLLNNLHILTLLLFLTRFSFGNTILNSVEKGVPYIQNYGHKTYGLHEQNWSAVQDTNGIMYFGNSDGLLEYDGSTWRQIKTVSPYIVRSIDISAENSIFLGGYNYFGYLVCDSTKTLSFRSLSDSLDDKYKPFGNVWNTYVVGSAVYFQTDTYLFRWDDNHFKVWQNSSKFDRSFSLTGTVYLTVKGKGLSQLNGEHFKLVPGGERFLIENIISMNSIGNNKILILTKQSKPYLLADGKIERFFTEIDNFLVEGVVTRSAQLSAGNIAISTRNKGLVVIDNQGRLLYHIDKNNGLAGNTVWNVYPDNQGGVWLPLNNGISRIELPAALTYFHGNNAIEGTVESIVRHKGVLYVATPQGIFYFDPEKPLASVQRIPAFSPYKLVSTGEDLIASGYVEGTWLLLDNRMVRISGHSAYRYLQSALNPDRLYIGVDNAIASIYKRDGRWIDEDFLVLQSHPVRDIVEDSSGVLWLGTSGGTIIRVQLNRPFSFRGAQITIFDEGKGLVFEKQNHIFNFKGQLLVGNGGRLLRYDIEKDLFIEHESFRHLNSGKSWTISELAEDSNGNLWMFGGSPDGYRSGSALREKDGSYFLNMLPLKPLDGIPFYCVYPDARYKNIIWYGGPDGLFRYDNSVVRDYNASFPCLVRRVNTLNDSLLYNGYSAVSNPNTALVLDYRHNSLRFSFSAPFYRNEQKNLFQYFLEGFDKKWSNWTNETMATYTNIPEGSYLFRARAKSIYGVLSKEAVYPFRIFPPWYRTWWAYGIYGLAVIFAGIGLVRLRSIKLENEKKELEEEIINRTEELRLKSNMLLEQAEKLKEMDKIKSRFFANISHEFRTPLTLIKGPAEEMLQTRDISKKDKAFRLILNNANRLLNLVNQLLDLSRLESGGVKLNAVLQPLSPFIEMVINLFSSFAESRKIHLQFIKPDQEIELFFDQHKLEQIIINLLSNAFKFTPENGFITVALHKHDTEIKYPRGGVEISVHDSGPGIPDDEIHSIFERFNQGQKAQVNRLAGSGIGLALVKELVNLHHGEIKVSSKEDEGTEFDIILPLGYDHLKPGEILELDSLKSGLQTDKTLFQSDILNPGIKQPLKETTDYREEKHLVLIVEDHAEVSLYIREHLENDYNVIDAGNGEEAFEIAREQLPDLVISDIMMPKMDGFRLTHSIKTDTLTSHIPVILLTARADHKDKLEGLQAGADAYMAKPFNALELKVRIDKLIESRHNLHQKYKRDFLIEPSFTEFVSIEERFLKRLHDTIELKMHRPDFNVEVLLNDFALSHRQFTRKVLALTGYAPVKFIRIMRLKKAKCLIEQKTGTISQIAYEVGFNNLSYFSKCFRDFFGFLPSEAQNNKT